MPLHAAQLAIVLSGDDAPYREFIGALKGAVGGSNWQIGWEGDSERFLQSPPQGTELVIAVGSKATRAALARPEGPPVIASLLTRSAFDAVRAESPVHRNGVSALYLDQPLGRQLVFIKRLLPDTSRIMTVTGNRMADQIPILKRLGAGVGLKVESAVLGTGDALVPVLERIMAEEGVFLALPDSSVFSRDNIRPFLLTSYRYQRPVIAFSSAFVQAGALASLHTTPTQLAQELAQWLGRLRPGGMTLPSPQGPARFSVLINAQVARSLKLDLPEEEEILSALTPAGAHPQ